MTEENKKPELNDEWAGLIETLEYEVRGILSTTTENAVEDLEKYVVPITQALVKALTEGKPLLMSELRDQLLAITEIHKVRFVKGGLQSLQSFLGAIFRVATQALRCKLPKE